MQAMTEHLTAVMKIVAALLVVLLCLRPAVAGDSKPAVRGRDLEQRIHDLINDARAANGRGPLQLDGKLSGIARAHSADMAQRGYFSHIDPAGDTPQRRVEQAGVSCTAIGENIFQNNLYTRVTIENNRTTHDWSMPEEIAATTVHGWMNSPGHRRNILEQIYVRDGVGVAIAADAKVYITQLFCTPR
jgi:uncharacterized protein YkwD